MISEFKNIRSKSRLSRVRSKESILSNKYTQQRLLSKSKDWYTKDRDSSNWVTSTQSYSLKRLESFSGRKIFKIFSNLQESWENEINSNRHQTPVVGRLSRNKSNIMRKLKSCSNDKFIAQTSNKNTDSKENKNINISNATNNITIISIK